jgi:hypothetical protein
VVKKLNKSFAELEIIISFAAAEMKKANVLKKTDNNSKPN